MENKVIPSLSQAARLTQKPTDLKISMPVGWIVGSSTQLLFTLFLFR